MQCCQIRATTSDESTLGVLHGITEKVLSIEPIAKSNINGW